MYGGFFFHLLWGLYSYIFGFFLTGGLEYGYFIWVAMDWAGFA